MKINCITSSPAGVCRYLAALFCLLLGAACSDSHHAGISEANIPNTLTGCADTGDCTPNPTAQIGGERPAQVRIPADYTTSLRYPLIIVLHGFGTNGSVYANILGLVARADSRQYVLVVPDGTENASGQRFWNATATCCALSPEDFKVDDVAYIRGLIEEAAATYSIDTNRIALIGHSNGGFMALRMACEAADVVTSVVSLSASTFADDASCVPAANPVSVLAVHGDNDEVVSYDGGGVIALPDGLEMGVGATYPGAKETIARFAAHARCDVASPAMPPNLDVAANIPGTETAVLEYSGCAAGADVSLWTPHGAGHILLPLVPAALDSFVDWMLEHSRQ